MNGWDVPGFSGPARREGYAEISVRSGGGVIGSVTFLTDDDRALASLPLEAAGRRSHVIAHVAQSAAWFTGVTLLNPSNLPVPVTVTVCDSTDRLIGSRVVHLMPRSKEARVISEWVSEAYPLLGGSIQLSAPEEILCFGLFGSPDLRILAAIPSQPAP